MKRSLLILVAAIVIAGLVVPMAHAADKIGYVDLRRAFYEYEKSKTFDAELSGITDERTKERDKMVEEIRKLRDEGELLKGGAKEKKQAEIDGKITALNEFDRVTRQELLNKKNDMFRTIIDNIQKVVEAIGKKNGCDYILDSRNVMYAKESFDLTDQVLQELNK